MDKDVTKRLLRDAGLNIAPFITLTRANRHNISFAEVESKLGLPLFVKPANQGSSVGVSKVTSEEQYAIAVDLAFEFDHKVIVEQGIKGREIECAVLGNDNPQASTCGEIVLTSDFYAYDLSDVGMRRHGACRRVFNPRERSGDQRDQHTAWLHQHQYVSEAVASQRSGLHRSDHTFD